MNFSDFNFKTDYLEEVNSFTYENNTINVKKYLPIEDKIDLIQIALQKAESEGVYNDLLLEVFFHLNMIYLYTDIEFSSEDRQDELKLYDILESNGIIDQVIELLGDEYKELREEMFTQESLYLEYTNSAAAVLRKIVTDLPKNAAAAKEIVDSFNPDQYKQVVDFATAANGGRNITTNMGSVTQ